MDNITKIEEQPLINPTSETDFVIHKGGEFQRARMMGPDGKIKEQYVKAVVNNYNSVTENNYNINVDPEQIVPTEAMLNSPANVETGESEIIAYDVLKRVDKGTRTEQIYKETTKNIDGINMTDAMVDGFMYIKRGSKYYINSDFAINREVYLESYGLFGDNTFRPISTVFPWVTLADVQLLDADATLSDSADWYMLMWLNYNLPVNSTVYLTGKYVINREITWRRSSIKWSGKTLRTSSKYQGDKVPQIRQIGEGKHCIAFRNGDGRTNHYGSNTQILNVTLENFNIVGTKTAELRSGHGILIDIPLGDMVFCYFNNLKVTNNGLSGIYHTMGHINEVYFSHCQIYANFDTGMWLDGKPSSQTNLLGFEFCGFSSNGNVIRDGVLRNYDHTIDGIDYTKGGISIGNLSSTDFNSINTQSNNGFGFMARDNASLKGVHVTAGYSEMNPLGDWVILALLESNFTLNAGSLYDISIFPDLVTGKNHFSVFKSLEHSRKFVTAFGLKYLRELERRPWSNNIIADAKNRIPFVSGGNTSVSNSRDEWGSLVTTVQKTPDGITTQMEWLTYEEWTRIPVTLEIGDMIFISFEVKFNLISPEDYIHFGGSQIGVLGYVKKPVALLESTPAIDGTWSRISFTHEYDGTHTGLLAARPFMQMVGNSPITYSVRNPQFKIKSKRGFFAESAPNATPILKGVVNQAAAVANVAAANATDLDTALTLVNELKAKLNAKLGADRTAGQQAM